MGILSALAATWLALVVLLPLQIVHDLGPLWSMVLGAGLVLGVTFVVHVRRKRREA